MEAEIVRTEAHFALTLIITERHALWKQHRLSLFCSLCFLCSFHTRSLQLRLNIEKSWNDIYSYRIKITSVTWESEINFWETYWQEQVYKHLLANLTRKVDLTGVYYYWLLPVLQQLIHNNVQFLELWSVSQIAIAIHFPADNELLGTVQTTPSTPISKCRDSSTFHFNIYIIFAHKHNGHDKICTPHIVALLCWIVLLCTVLNCGT